MKEQNTPPTVHDAMLIVIGLADVLCLLRDTSKLSDMGPHARYELFKYIRDYAIPIAHRLNLIPFKLELEDLYLQRSFPPLYHATNHMLGTTKKEREEFIDQFKNKLVSFLEKEGFSFTIRARVKSIQSIIRKQGRLEAGVSDIYDVYATRIILDTPPDEEKATCWEVCRTLKEHYEILTEKSRDWLTAPRENGYQSLHLTLRENERAPWVEVQIRSKEMDAVAETGSAAHWKYKDSSKTNNLEGFQELLSGFRTLLEKNPDIANMLIHSPEKLASCTKY